jgi:hypothetical protein
MASDFRNNDRENVQFSFGVRELRQAEAAAESLTLEDPKQRPREQNRGADPYNTSGSFDRKKNWARVGKR